MSLIFQQKITTSQGDDISVDAADGDFMKITFSNPTMAFLQQDIQNIIVLFQSLANAKQADARLKLIAKPKG